MRSKFTITKSFHRLDFLAKKYKQITKEFKIRNINQISKFGKNALKIRYIAM